MWTPSCQCLLFGSLRQRHGVVEVAGVGRVDGDDQVAGEVLAAVEVVFVEGGGGVAGLLQGVLGKLVGQAEGADDRQRIDARLAARPEHLGDDAFAAVLRRREAQHLEDDLVVGPGALGPGIADVDAVAEDGAVDADVALAVALEVGADELPRGPLQDAQDLAAGAEVGPVGLARDADQHLVAGGGVEGVVFGG